MAAAFGNFHVKSGVRGCAAEAKDREEGTAARPDT